MMMQQQPMMMQQQPMMMGQQPMMMGQQPMMMGQPMMMQPPMMMPPSTVIMGGMGRRQERYCGPLSWVIGIVICAVTGLGPVVFCCPCDERFV